MCEAFFEWQPMKASRLRCNAAGTCPSLQGGGEPVWALFVPPPRFRCRVHAIEISASGHGWLSLAVKIKRQCRRSTSGGVRGDAGLPPAMGLRNRSVVLAGDIVGGQGWARGRRGDSGARVQGALQGRVLLATLRSTVHTCKLCTGSLPPSGGAYEPREATTCVSSVVHRLGVTKRPFGACSARTSPIFPSRFH